MLRRVRKGKPEHPVDARPPGENIDWRDIRETRRVWMPDVGGDQRARLEFLADQGLRLIMADLGPASGETLHFFNPRDRETLHLRAGKEENLLSESVRYFPQAARWIDLIRGSQMDGVETAAGAVFMERWGLLLEVSGGRVRRVYETASEYPQGALCGTRARQAGFLLEKGGGMEGTARSAAFFQALEDARGMKIPAAAVAIHAALLEMSRVCAHLFWISGAAGLLGRPGTAGRCAELRCEVEEGMEEWLGDPQGRGCFLPGGVREDFPVEEAPAMAERLVSAAGRWEEISPKALSLPVPGWVERRLRSLYREAKKEGWVGPLARSAGLAADVREEEPGPYAVVGWGGVKLPKGGGMFRRVVGVRAFEIGASLHIAGRILENIPEGPLQVKRGRGGRGEGFGRCEGPEGEVCCHVIMEKGQVSSLAFSLPGELNRSAARCLEGAWLDEVELLSLLWEAPAT
jgi:Ni,Fe-hydrogenase III large subunit